MFLRTSNSCILIVITIFIANAAMSAADKALFISPAGHIIEENRTATLAKVSIRKTLRIY
jgi:hypothetical protein